ncbi:MAG: oxamate carbamoyltransferase subunit AllH family protein [Candidatus Hodarchaeales archaeon]
MKQLIRILENQLIILNSKIEIDHESDKISNIIAQDAVLYSVGGNYLDFRNKLNNISIVSIKRLYKPLIKVLGIGEGSTPISDDFLIGIFFTINLTDPSLAIQIELLSQFPFQRYTTSKSAQLIRRFLRKNYPKEVTAIMDLFKDPLNSNSSVLKLETEINRVKLIGASSGYYFLLGALWELKYTSNLRES